MWPANWLFGGIWISVAAINEHSGMTTECKFQYLRFLCLLSLLTVCLWCFQKSCLPAIIAGKRRLLLTPSHSCTPRLICLCTTACVEMLINLFLRHHVYVTNHMKNTCTVNLRPCILWMLYLAITVPILCLYENSYTMHYTCNFWDPFTRHKGLRSNEEKERKRSSPTATGMGCGSYVA